MKSHLGKAALLVTASVGAIAQPAVAEIVHLRITGTFTIGDRRGEDFLVELRYDSDAPVTDTLGTTSIFRNAGDIFTIGDRRDDFTAAAMRSALPNYVSTVYDLGPPRGVVEQTPNGRRVSFTDPNASLGSVSFFYDTTTPPSLLTRLPTLSELSLFSGGVVTFGNSSGTFRYEPFASNVPEPATWGMMILGFGVMGAAMRHRRRKLSVSYV